MRPPPRKEEANSHSPRARCWRQLITLFLNKVCGISGKRTAPGLCETVAQLFFRNPGFSRNCCPQGTRNPVLRGNGATLGARAGELIENDRDGRDFGNSMAEQVLGGTMATAKSWPESARPGLRIVLFPPGVPVQVSSGRGVGRCAGATKADRRLPPPASAGNGLLTHGITN